MASAFVEGLLAIEPEGPFHLGGHSFGGVLAYEIAQQLIALGGEVGLLAFFDVGGKGYPLAGPEARWRSWITSGPWPACPRGNGSATSAIVRCAGRAMDRSGSGGPNPGHRARPSPRRASTGWPPRGRIPPTAAVINRRAWRSYRPLPFAGRLVASGCWNSPSGPASGSTTPPWGGGPLARGGVEVSVDVPGDHLTLMFQPENARVLARSLRRCPPLIAPDPRPEPLASPTPPR